ncbi:hypothetical protein BDV11DRAFT_19849 [Aspergillus similis]
MFFAFDLSLCFYFLVLVLGTFVYAGPTHYLRTSGNREHEGRCPFCSRGQTISVLSGDLSYPYSLSFFKRSTGSIQSIRQERRLHATKTHCKIS